MSTSSFSSSSPGLALATARIVVCGAGAIGSHLVESLARQGARGLRAIDRDRVEPKNLANQAYSEADVGARKAEALKARVFRAVGAEIVAVPKELNAGNAVKLLGACDLVVVAFDNALARRDAQAAARASGAPCLHVGLFPDYAEAIWDRPGLAIAKGPDDAEAPCLVPLGHNLVLLAVALAGETILRWLAHGRAPSWTVTMKDLAVHALDDEEETR